MIRQLTNIIAVIVLALQASAMTAVSDTVPTLTARACLSVAPDHIFPYISKNVRLDMIDYYDAGSNKPSKNVYGGDCRILSQEDNYDDTSSITVQVADSATVQIFVLNANTQRPVIGIIETIPTPIPDSTVKFYDRKWNELSGIMANPTISDWLMPDMRKQKATVERNLPFILMAYAYVPATKTIAITQNMDKYFTGSGSNESVNALCPKLNYQWTGKAFKAEKK